MSQILVVDDELRIRDVYRHLFERKGHHVITAGNVEEAREILKGHDVDLMLLDINTGDIKGDILYDIAQAFHRHVKVIVSSVYPVDEQQILMPQADDYFDKSEGNSVLIEKVNQVLAIQNA